MHIFRLIIALCVLGGIVGILLGFLGWLHPAFDTFAHFRLHGSLALLGLAVFGIYFRFILLALAGLIVAIGGLYYSMSGTVFASTQKQAEPSKPIYSMLHFNAFWTNPVKAKVIDRILDLDPDLISFGEGDTSWEEEIKRLDAKWPYMLHCPEHDDHGGIRFYSKWKLDETDQYCGPYGSLARTNVLSPEGVSFTSGSVHLRWPWPASGPEQLREITPELQKFGSNALIAGDFNATTWSHALKTFEKQSGMQIVPGIGPTWIFSELPISYFWWAGLPIDNVLEKGSASVISAKSLEDLGSDHLPVLVQFQIK